METSDIGGPILTVTDSHWIDEPEVRCYFAFTMNTHIKVRNGLGVFRALLIYAVILTIFALGAIPPSQAADKANLEGSSGGDKTSAAQKGGKLYKLDMSTCGGFTAEDAAGILGLPPAKMTAKTKELYSGFWQCAFESGVAAKTVEFGVTVAKSVDVAARDMEQYRSHLETTGSVAPFKDKLPKGAYSDIGGLGDEAVWTDINNSLSVRQGNITILVSMPKEKLVQIKVAEKFLTKLK